MRVPYDHRGIRGEEFVAQGEASRSEQVIVVEERRRADCECSVEVAHQSHVRRRSFNPESRIVDRCDSGVVDALSTTITSTVKPSCVSTLSIVSKRRPQRLYVGISTVMSASPFVRAQPGAPAADRRLAVRCHNSSFGAAEKSRLVPGPWRRRRRDRQEFNTVEAAIWAGENGNRTSRIGCQRNCRHRGPNTLRGRIRSMVTVPLRTGHLLQFRPVWDDG